MTAKLPSRKLVMEALREIMAQTAVPAIAVDMNVAGDRLSVLSGTVAVDDSRPVTAQSAFRIACLVKFFGSLVCLQLAEAGSLDMDAPVGFYLPELNAGPGSKGQTIRIRHLMTHTAGYRGLDIEEAQVWTKWDWKECAEFFMATPQYFAPGTVYSEGHFDHVILGEILWRMTGQLAPELIAERIFHPLGIVPSTVVDDMNDPQRHIFGHKYSVEEKRLQKMSGGERPGDAWVSSLSNITLRIEDMGLLGAALAGLPGSDAKGVFSPKILDGLRTPVIAIPRASDGRKEMDWMPEAFSLGGGVFPKGRAGYLAVGKGQNCAIVLDAEHQVSVAIALTAAAANVRALILDRIFSLICGATHAVPPPRRPFDGLLRHFRLEQIIGRYTGCFPESIIVTGDHRQVAISMGTYFRVTLELLADGQMAIKSQSLTPISFFADPMSGAPSIMLGMHAFKKVA